MPPITLCRWLGWLALIPLAALGESAMVTQPVTKFGNGPSGYSTSGPYGLPGCHARLALEKRGLGSERLGNQRGLLPRQWAGAAHIAEDRPFLPIRLVDERGLLPAMLRHRPAQALQHRATGAAVERSAAAAR